MGLLSTEVEVRLTGSNIKYYEDLGYEIPRYYNHSIQYDIFCHNNHIVHLPLHCFLMANL